MVAALEISLRIGQRVRHHDFHGKRVTGVVRGLSVDSENVLHADIALDEAIVIAPINADDHELRIYRQCVPAHELSHFDERDELVDGMLGLLQKARQQLPLAAASWNEEPQYQPNVDAVLALIAEIDAAIAKATGSAA